MNDPHAFSRGFLSEVVRDVRADVHAKYPDLVALLQEVNAEAVALQHALEFREHEPADLYGAALYARALASTQACVVLLEHGLVSQARTILRSALECLFPLCAIAKDRSLAGGLLDSHNADRRTLADRMKRWQDPALRAAVAAELESPSFAAALQSKSRAINQYELAKLADMEDWYLSLYTLLSFSAHGAVSDLAAHLVEGLNDDLEALQNEPQIHGQTETWLYTVEVQLRAIQAVTRLVAAAPPALSHFEERLRGLAKNAA
jgi:hypothetical protein